MKNKTLFLFVLLLCAGFKQAGADVYYTDADEKNAQKNMRLIIEYKKTDYAVGAALDGPLVTFSNVGGIDLKLIGPTLTVVECTLVSPTGASRDAVLKMPTNMVPESMLTRPLKKGNDLNLQAPGIWSLDLSAGYVPYQLKEAGKYKISCTYEQVRSNEVSVEAR